VLKNFKDKQQNACCFLKSPGAVPPLGSFLEGEKRSLPLKAIYEPNTKQLTLSKPATVQNLFFTYSETLFP